MLRLKIFIISIFSISLVVAILSPIQIETVTYVKALFVFWLFSFLYSYQSVVIKKGKVNLDYGISYGLALALFVGPLGIFIFETIHRFTVYFNKKLTKTADPDEFLHTFYNIGAFALNNSIAYVIFINLYPYFTQIPFGFWVLVIMLVGLVSLLSDLYLITIFSITGDIQTRKEAVEFIKGRSILDMGKTAISNGLLFIFLQGQQWEMLVGLFVLNYLVSRSFVAKSQSLQHKIERDKFEQMAYTDFLTEVYNRTYMDKKMNELNSSNEYLGIIVGDIDTFKRINDTYNHAVGDHVIQHFATILRSYLHDGDYLFRSGGEEFTIFLRNRDFNGCVTLINYIQQEIGNSPTTAEYQSGNVTITYTASFGMYFYLADGNTEIKKAYVYADDLLMQSKEHGKNRVSIKNGLTDLPVEKQINP